MNVFPLDVEDREREIEELRAQVCWDRRQAMLRLNHWHPQDPERPEDPEEDEE